MDQLTCAKAVFWVKTVNDKYLIMVQDNCCLLSRLHPLLLVNNYIKHVLIISFIKLCFIAMQTL